MTVTVTRLESGLTVATDRMEEVETVSLGVWVGVGTRNEQAEMNGVAHLLEHMAFKGTKRRTAQQIAEEIEAVGGQINAYTSRENTAYYVKVLRNDVALAVDILADILQNSTFDEAELARERAVIVQEIGQAADTPDDIIFDYFQEAAYPGQAIGRPVLGRAEVVESIPRETVMAYMRRHYLPSRMVVAAAGRVDHDRFVGLAGEAFGSLPSGDPETLATARYGGGEWRAPRELEQVHLVLGFEGIRYNDPDYYAQSVFSTLLGGGMSSRLFQEVREKRGLAYSIYSFTSPYTDGGLFGIYAGTGEAEAAELVPVVCDELAGAARRVAAAEIARAKAQGRAAVLMARERTSARCEQLGHNILIYGRPLPLDEILGGIEAVDEAAIGRVADRLVTSRPTLAAVGPLSHVESYERLARRIP
ncbi:MAG: pitrilysin family protein [Alphaproteobacteria bacterium]